MLDKQRREFITLVGAAGLLVAAKKLSSIMMAPRFQQQPARWRS